jgi:hypothetical protein
MQPACSSERATAVMQRPETLRTAMTIMTKPRQLAAGRYGIFAGIVVEPVSGFEPLTVRLQEGLSFARSERDFTAISPLACIKAYPGLI